MNNNRFVVDEATKKELVAKFKLLNSKQLAKVHKQALAKWSRFIRNRIRLDGLIVPSYNTPNWWDGKTMREGVQEIVYTNSKGASVHGYGDFRIKFFEYGTKQRYTKGHETDAGRRLHRDFKNTGKRKPAGLNRGTIISRGFFFSHLPDYEEEANKRFEHYIRLSINKVWEKG